MLVCLSRRMKYFFLIRPSSFSSRVALPFPLPMLVFEDQPETLSVTPVDSMRGVSSHDFLLQFPSGTFAYPWIHWCETIWAGAYTTMRTVEGTRILHLSVHIQRLSDTLRSLDYTTKDQEDSVNSNGSVRESPEVSMALAPYRSQSNKFMESLVLRLVRHALRVSSSMEPTIMDWKVTISIFYSAKEKRVRSLVHVANLTEVPNDQGVTVEIQGNPRHNANAKDLQWVK